VVARLRAYLTDWRRPEILLILFSVAMPLSFDTWMALINNFSVERAGFTGVEIGILQSLREVPGFLTFTVVFVLFLVNEQRLAWISLVLLGAGTALTAQYPTVYGIYTTTVIMSVGFHYFESVKQSLALQWIDTKHLPEVLGRLVSVGAFSGLVVFGAIFLAKKYGGVDMGDMYAVGGGLTLALAVFAWVAFPKFGAVTEQHKTIIVRKRYWLFYLLMFMSGARRQIFVVFAPFLMVDTFGLDAEWLAALMFINLMTTMIVAPAIGRMVARFGERMALTFEYAGLICIFAAYAFVDSVAVAAVLYVLDHVFFAMAIAIKSYFQKIADPADIASTSGVSFTISHIVAVVLPAAYGFLWVISPAAVFLSGAAMAGVSLVLARLVPNDPGPGNEALVFAAPKPQPAQ
jgi:hypothetical protein